ncbi:MAG: hypothetical protein J2P48_01520 [Alphaproteobacteria bacterium]|nr:hypothetical protein [Alphaproteobacteria bacterium]
MPSIGLAEAARLCGKNQSTIHRAMQAGRLSYTRDEAGERRIDVAELERVFGIKPVEKFNRSSGNGASVRNDAGPVARKITQGGELAALQRLLDDRERTIADLREAIRDYRTRLDKSEADRERIQERLTGLLTHRQAGSVPSVTPANPVPLRRPWWRRLFR